MEIERNLGKANKERYVKWGIFIVLMYFPLFLHLHSMPIVLWDESLFALRALYMYDNWDYMPDFSAWPYVIEHRNTKLPATTILQVVGLKLFGINELGLRLPVIGIYIGAVWFFIREGAKRLGSENVGLLFALLLLSSTRFVGPHMLRTGDQDAPLAMYLILALYQFYRFVDSQQTKHLAYFTTWILSALLTKNLMVGTIGPALVLYLLMQGKFIQTLKDYRIYIALAFIVGLYVALLAYLEYRFPGFVQQMWNYELGGRYNKTIENHYFGPWYYFQMLTLDGINLFVYFFPVALGFSFDKKMPQVQRNLLWIMALGALSYLFIISQSKTQTAWYATPIYPMAAMVSAIGMWHWYHQYIKRWPVMAKWGMLALFALAYGNLYWAVMQQNYHPEAVSWNDKYGLFIPEALEKHPEIKSYTIVDTDFGTTAYFYKEMYNRKVEGMDIKFRREYHFELGSYIMSCQVRDLQALRDKFHCQLVHNFYEGDCEIIRLDSLK
jgi:4-amino-4-deoxy-L-arabinose transferase-like glycosyltransferase